MTVSDQSSPKKYATILVYTIIAVNAILYILSLIYSKNNIRLTFHPLHAFAPSQNILEFLGMTGRAVILRNEHWWSLVTANWLHLSLLHIVFNMMALRTVGQLVIDEFGKARMFSIYTLSGVFGFFLSVMFNSSNTAGASAGICGLVGALWFFGLTRGGEWGRTVYRQTSIWVLFLGISGFIIPHINNTSHLGGLIGGVALGFAFGYLEKRRTNLFDVSLAVLLGGLTVWLLGERFLEAFFLIDF